jgi:predicted CoA-binding protein
MSTVEEILKNSRTVAVAGLKVVMNKCMRKEHIRING